MNSVRDRLENYLIAVVLSLILIIACSPSTPPPTTDVTQSVEAATATKNLAATDTSTPTIAEEPTPVVIPTVSVTEILLEDARHFQGEPDAPVTIIEYSDFK